MNSDWRSVTASEICADCKNSMSTGPFGSAISSKFFVEEGIPVIRGKNLSQEIGIRLNHNNLVYLTTEKANEFSRSIVRPGDLIFTCWGTIDQVGFIDENSNFDAYVISNKQMKMTPDCSLADSEFLYYQFSSPKIRRWILGNGIGSSVPGFNLGMLKRIELLLPPISEQKVIANILATFDEKIALNIKTNETFEGIAKSLFKSWFIDFDPVKAKVEGHSTGLPDEISNLFPNSFEDSSLGEIPNEWKESCLGDIFSIQGGTQPPAKTFVEDQREGFVRLLQIRDFLKDNHITYVPSSKNLRLVDEDDVLIGRYGSGNGKFMDDSLGRPLRGLSGAINVAIVKTIPKQKNMIELIYAMVLSGWFYRKVVGGTSRAVQAGFRKEDLDLIPFALPPNNLLDVFQSIGSDIWEKSKLIQCENKSLSSIRDTLLVKLISGELRIPDAEKILEEVGI